MLEKKKLHLFMNAYMAMADIGCNACPQIFTTLGLDCSKIPRRFAWNDYLGDLGQRKSMKNAGNETMRIYVPFLRKLR